MLSWPDAALGVAGELQEGVQQHVVIRQECDVAGTRERSEVGIFTQTHAARPPVPWGKLGVGDLVWMKWSPGRRIRGPTVWHTDVSRRSIVGARQT